MISFTSAFEWDNVEEFDKNIGDYGKYEIKNSLLGIDWLSYGRVADLELKSNTEMCSEDCNAIKEITLYEEGSLVDDVRFYTIKNDERYLQDIRSYEFFVKTGNNEVMIDDHEIQCNVFGKNSSGQDNIICDDVIVGTHLEDVPIWSSYIAGTEVPTGTYTVKLKGKKDPKRIVDWQIKSNGIWTQEWAIWNNTNLTTNLTSYYKLDNNDLSDSLGVNDLTNFGSTNVSGIIIDGRGFDGVTQNASAASFWSMPPAVSYSFWLNTTDGNAGVLQMFVDSSTKDGIFLTSGKIVYESGPSAGSNDFWTSTPSLPTSQWVHVVVTNDGLETATSGKIYFNGTEVGSAHGSNGADRSRPTGTATLYLDADGALVSNYAGDMDEIGIYDRNLSDGDILELYNSGAGFTYPFVEGTVTLNSPADSSTSSIAVNTFNGTATITGGSTLVNMSLYTNESGSFLIRNSTTGLASATSTQIWNRTLSDGNYLWNVEACDSDGDCGFSISNFTLLVDSSPPQINVSAPSGIINFNIVGNNETLNTTFTDPNLDSCWFDYNTTNITIPGCVTAVLNSTNFTLEEGNTNITIYANDTEGNENSSFISWDYRVLETSISFTSPVVELSTQEFIINVTSLAGTSIQSADLIYNGTRFATADKTPLPGNSFILSKTINIPAGTTGFVSENRTFFWNITSVNETTGLTLDFNSSESTQLVNELEFGLCDGSLDVPILNFTMFNEVDGLEINATENATTFQSTFLVGASSDNLVKNISINEIGVNTSRFNFCTTDNTTTIFANMELFYTANGFSDKNYFLNNATLTNNTNLISLFLLPESLSVQFFITVERDLFPLQNAVVNVDKFFVGQGFFQTVEIDTTDSSGEFTSFLDLDKDYRFTIVLDGQPLAIINKTAICQAAPCTFTLSITEDSVNLLSGLSEAFASNVLYNLSYNGATKIVTFQFIDTTGLATSFRMVITKTVSNETGATISDQRIFTSSGSMTFNMSGQQGDFRVDTFIARSPDQFIDFITLVISEFTQVLGILGLLTALLFILVIIFGVALKPQLLIMSIPLALFLTKLMGLISLSNTALMSIAVLAAIAVAFTSK